MIDFPDVSRNLREMGLDGWLLYDFRGSNPLINLIAGKKLWTTRRLYYFVPASGDEPVLLVNRLDASHTTLLPGRRLIYTDRHQLASLLADKLLHDLNRVAMEYSPNGDLPVVSVVDGGTIDLIRSLGIEVVSSADLQQSVVAVWSDNAREEHHKASELVGKIKDQAFEFIAKALSEGSSVTDFDAQQFIMRRFNEEGLETDEPPVVATNERSGDPHYTPTSTKNFQIIKGDWVLIDLWARIPGEENIFSDITWVGVMGREPSAKEQEVFTTVKAGRDRAIQRMKEILARNRQPQGWEIDAATRKVISDAGYADYFIHRTGHSLSPGKFVHGTGVNLDDFETRDNRSIIPRVGWTVEPGIYLPEFGCRLEINGWMTSTGPEITSVVQDHIIVKKC